MNVLIIDDAKELCTAVKKCLESRGYGVDTAYDGKSGLRKALTNEYDIILLDIMMPQMNGYEVIKKLRAEKRQVPTIMITAKGEVSDMVEGLELGADDYLQKPFNIDILTAKIRALARRSNLTDYDSDLVEYSDFSLRLSSRKLSTDKLEITLDDGECEMMKYFIKNSTVIIAPEKLEKVCEKPADGCVERLSKKLRYVCSDAKIIKINGIGYKLC